MSEADWTTLAGMLFGCYWTGWASGFIVHMAKRFLEIST